MNDKATIMPFSPRSFNRFGMAAAIVLGCWSGVGSLPAAAATDCRKVLVRTIVDGEISLEALGADVELRVGRRTVLYVHFRSLVADPFGTTSELGLPSDFGYFEYSVDDVARLIDVEPQSDEDRRIGRIVMMPAKKGFTAIAYRILALNEPGHVNNVSQECRQGLIPIHVTNSEELSSNHHQDIQLERFRAADRLVSRLVEGIADHSRASFYPKEYLDRVYSDGYGGLIVILAETLATLEFETAEAGSEPRLPARVLEALHGVHSRPATDSGHAEALTSCAAAEVGLGCIDLAQLLVTHPRFKSRHSDLLPKLLGEQ